MSEKADDDNVVYLERKLGFYKKGPLKFKLYFGTLDELADDATGEPDLKPLSGNPDEEPDQTA